MEKIDLFRHIADQDPLEEGDGPIAIIMTPTRELCLQIGNTKNTHSSFHPFIYSIIHPSFH